MSLHCFFVLALEVSGYWNLLKERVNDDRISFHFGWTIPLVSLYCSEIGYWNKTVPCTNNSAEKFNLLLFNIVSAWSLSTGTFHNFTILFYLFFCHDCSNVLYQETFQSDTPQMSVNTCSSQLKWQWHDSCLQFQVRYLQIWFSFASIDDSALYNNKGGEIKQKCLLPDAPSCIVQCTGVCL